MIGYVLVTCLHIILHVSVLAGHVHVVMVNPHIHSIVRMSHVRSLNWLDLPKSTVVRCCRCNINMTLYKIKTILYVRTYIQSGTINILGIANSGQLYGEGGANLTEVGDLQCS